MKTIFRIFGFLHLLLLPGLFLSCSSNTGILCEKPISKEQPAGGYYAVSSAINNAILAERSVNTVIQPFSFALKHHLGRSHTVQQLLSRLQHCSFIIYRFYSAKTIQAFFSPDIVFPFHFFW